MLVTVADTFAVNPPIAANPDAPADTAPESLILSQAEVTEDVAVTTVCKFASPAKTLRPHKPEP